MKRLLLLSLYLFSMIQPSFAGVDDSLGKVWSSLDGESVSTDAQYYKGQKAGHMSFGSMYLAKQKKNRPLISVNPPEIALDKSCYNQGVLNFGGLSFISGDELKNKLESITKQAGMMYVYMAISAISPVIGETLQEVYSKLQELGGFLSDECQTANQIASFAGDKLVEHSELAKNIYTKYQTMKGKKGDYSKTLEQYPKDKSSVLSEVASKDERYLLEDVNLAWKALEKLNGVSAELKEFMMTVSGTIIIRASKNGTSPPSFQHISSTITNAQMLEALLKGDRDMKVLKCTDSKKCLHVNEQTKTISKEKSFEYKVSSHMDKIEEALLEDKELESSSQRFLNTAGLPIYAIYDVLYRSTSGNPHFEKGPYVEMVAWNILYNYLAEMLKEVSEATNNLQIASNKELKNFRNSLRETQKLLSGHEMRDMTRYQLQLMLVKKAEQMESTNADQMSQFVNHAQ